MDAIRAQPVGTEDGQPIARLPTSLCLGFEPADHDAVMQRTELHADAPIIRVRWLGASAERSLGGAGTLRGRVPAI